MRNKLLITLFIVFTLLYLSMTLVSAETGCCFNPNDGLCDMNADEASCNDNAGEFFSSPSCSVSQCDLGCCVLGTSTLYVTSRTCELQSRAFGYEENFQSMDSASCAQLASSQEYGACLLGGDYEQDCRYVPREQCGSSDFYPGILCSNESLNTICEKTEKTICWSEDGSNEDVYYLDSCGNKDALKNDCNYQSGTLCSKESSASSNYICKDLSCKVENKTWQNGESWCVFASGIEGNGQGCNMANEWWIGCFTDLGKVEANTQSDVGSRYLKKYCLNGEVQTEPCSDYRTEYCLPGKAEKNSTNSSTSSYTSFPESKCEQNPWTDCLSANAVSGSSGDSPTSLTAIDQKVKQISESCDSESCFMFRALDCVSVTGTDSETGGAYSTDFCGANRDNYASTGDAGGTVAESTSDMMKSLGLEMCLPKIAGGLESSSSSTSSTESICSMGNFQGEVVFRKDVDSKMGNDIEKWGLDIEFGGTSNDETLMKLLSYEALTTGQKNYYDWEQIYACDPGNDYCTRADEDATTLPVNPMLLELLNRRCSAIADCAGKVNWVGKPGSNVPSGSELILSQDEGWKKTYTFTYTCSQWKAPSSGDDCAKCGEDGLACSEYRCKSLGKKCEFKEPESADRGYCVSSTDNTGPSITSFNMNPPSPVPPYEKVYFNLTTNEASECKFNLNSAGASYDEMKYDFGSGFAFTHEMILSLPGQVPNTDSLEEYAIIGTDISKDLNYTLYVRCLDAAGNGEASVPYSYNFQVMKTPDTIAPTITSFSPASGSAIAYNTTTKLISFKMNEPAECKWDFNDKKYEQMENNFSCETMMKVSVDNSGYSCEGTLTNITLNMSLQTKFFFKCRDQPWLTSGSVIVNGVNYSRNTNSESFQYILRPSSKLTILEVSPVGTIKKPVTNISVELKVTTSGGAANGKAECWWKLNNASAIIFKVTNASTSKQIITSPSEGTNNLRIDCNDVAGNSVEKNASFNLIIDKSAPFINRLYWSSSTLKIKTDEDSLCYVSFDENKQCGFDIFNINMSILMSGSEKMHTAEWKNDETYFIKCQDYFGNYDSSCGKIIRTY